MRNLKKSLAFVLVLALTLTTFVGAAFTDVAADNDYSTEISMLNDLGVLTGYPDNTFRPEGAITRNEAAAVVYRMLSGKTSADNFKGATKFSDISADHWASGYVNYASENGIITGYPDGTFKGDQQVTFAEYATMLVRALGLDPNGTASYPFGFISIADREKITAKVDLIANDAALRGAVAKMSYNAIIDANYAAVATANNDYTVGEYVFGLESVTGILVEAGKLGNTGNDNDEIYVNDADTGNDVISGTYLADPSLFGQEVKVWFKGDTAEDSDDVTYASNVDEIYAVVATGTSKTVTVPMNDVDDVDGSTISYTLNGNDKTLTLDTGAFGYVNGKKADAVAATSVTTALTGFNTRVPSTVTFVDSDNDKEYDLVMVDKYVLGKVTDVTSKAIYFDTDVGYGYNSTYSDTQRIYLVNPTDSDETLDINYPSDIATDDYALVKASATGDHKADIILLDKLTGSVTARSGSNYTIDGTTYALGQGLSAPSVGSTYEYYVASDAGYNYIVKISDTSAAEDYLVVTSTAGTYDDVDGTLKVKVALADGTNKAMYIDVTEFTLANLATMGFGADSDDYTDGTVSVATGKIYKYSVDKDGYIDTLTATGIDDDEDTYTVLSATDSTDLYTKSSKLLEINATTAQIQSTSLFFVVKSDGSAKVYTGSVPSFTVATKAYVDVNDTTAALPKVKAASVVLDTTGNLSAGTDNTDVIGLVKGTSVNETEDGATATLTVAIGGELKTYTTEEVSVTEANDIADYDKSYIQFDITADGTIDSIDQIAAPDFTVGSGYLTDAADARIGKLGTFDGLSAGTDDGLFTNAKVVAISGDVVQLADVATGANKLNLTLADDVKYYRVTMNGDKSEVKTLESGGSIVASTASNTRTIDFVYDYDTDPDDCVITAVFIYDAGMNS